jgi:hypothetical protein
MKKRRISSIIWLMLILVLKSLPAFSQVSINGAHCVIPGVKYQYFIGGDSTTTQSGIQICVQGGIIADTNITCYNGPFLPYVFVIWNENTVNGFVRIASVAGTDTLNITRTRELSAGLIDTSAGVQIVSVDSIPAPLNCSVAIGGNCNPFYQYQWQQSVNGVEWTNIPYAADINLSFSAQLPQLTYFRRQVTETISTSVAYSNVIMIQVVP